MVVGRHAGAHRAGIGPVLPEERARATPVTPGEGSGVTIDQKLNDVLVAAAPGGSTILDSAPPEQEDTEQERRERTAAQEDCRGASRYRIAFSRLRTLSKRRAMSVQFTTFHQAVT